MQFILILIILIFLVVQSKALKLSIMTLSTVFVVPAHTNFTRGRRLPNLFQPEVMIPFKRFLSRCARSYLESLSCLPGDFICFFLCTIVSYFLADDEARDCQTLFYCILIEKYRHHCRSTRTFFSNLRFQFLIYFHPLSVFNSETNNWRKSSAHKTDIQYLFLIGDLNFN